jgi:hypothetical protein
MRAPFFPIVASVAIAVFSACLDPVHSDAVDALGPEAPGVREGPTHRPGQPCLTCHGGDGPGPDFAVAGTVYETRNGTAALPNVAVLLRDSAGTTRTAITNSAGNFYITAGEWTPAFPMFAELHYGDITTTMVTRIGRNGGCAECHRGGGLGKMPPVYLKEVAE